MSKEELLAMLAKKKVSGCCMGQLGYILGHLTDHGLSEAEVRAAIDFILQAIFKLKADPAAVKRVEEYLESLKTVMEA